MPSPSSAPLALDAETRARLKVLAEQATPGPWRSDSPSHPLWNAPVVSTESGAFVARCATDAQFDGMADAAYIAALSPSVVLALLRDSARPIFAEIAAERVRQDKQWGAMHDDEHVASDWYAFRNRFEHRALTSMAYMNPNIQRENVVKIAALAVAQIESLDRQAEFNRATPPVATTAAAPLPESRDAC